MAGLTKEQRAAKASADQNSQQVADDSHLIAVEKDGETLRVHPTALENHKRLGWKISPKTN